MIQTVNNSDFHYAFNRMDRGNQFSYEALNLIYEYLEQFEEQAGEQIELDVIAICCDYSEMTYEDVMTSYNIENTDLLDTDDKEELEKLVLSYLEDRTQVLGHTSDGSIVFQQF